MALGSIGGNARVVVDFVANTQGLSSGLREAQTQASTTGSRFKGMGKAALIGAGAAGLGALVAVAKTGAAELGQAAKVAAQTEAVIKSTGGAAGVSAKDVGELSEALMMKSGVDDEAIASGQNLLLTFTRIRNEAGKGNDVFDQATKATLDMSVAMGTDMKSSAVLVGKALNDPVKGLTALTRVGVSFTEAQKAQITAMSESGDVAGAQKIILQELNKEFGGSAEAAGKTLPGQLAIGQEAFANLAGEIVGVLVPAFTAIATFFRENPKLAKAVVIGVLALAAAVVVLNGVMLVMAVITAPISGTFLLIAAGLAALVAIVILTIRYWDQIVAAFQVGWGWLKANWPLLLPILLGPIGIAALAIIRHWDAIWDKTTSIFNAIKSFLTASVNATANVLRAVWNGLIGFFAGLAGRIAGAFDAVRSWLRRPGEWAEDAAGMIRSAWNSLLGFLGGIPGRIAGIFDGVRSWLKRPGQWAQEGVDAVKSAFNEMMTFLNGLVDKVGAVASRIGSALKTPINAVINAINAVQIPRVSISIPSFKIGPKKFGGGSVGIGPFDPFGHVPTLARGGVVASPTLAMIGEGGGREIVAPEELLREIVGANAPEVRVYIGDTELRAMVRYEVRTESDRTAQTLLAGLR